MQRQKDKQIKHKIKERVDILEKVDKDDIRIDIAKWVTSLSVEEAELCNTLMIEHTKMHVRNYSIATLEIFENFLIDKNYINSSEIIDEFTELLSETGNKLQKIEQNGGNYYMSLNNDREKIINYYKERREKVSHEEAMRDVYIIFSKYSKSSLKNVIKTSIKAEEIDKETNKETNKEADTEVKEVVDETNIETNKETNKENNCASKTCDFMKDSKCQNKYVVSGEKTCINFNVDKVDTLNTESKAKIFFDENKDKDRKQLIKECALKFDVKETTIERYYSNYKKESEEKKKQSIINEDFEREVQDMINSSKGEKEMSKFTILKKVVVLDLQGECGQYHIENNAVTVADKVYKSIADVDNEFKSEEDELTKKLIELRKSKEELKQVMKEYVNEV